MIYRFLIISAFLIFIGQIALNFASFEELPEGFSHRWARTDFKKTLVPFSEISKESINLDEIKEIDNPVFIDTKYVNHLADNEPVISVALFGDYRAYPLRILLKHAVVNDVVGNVPVAVTYSPTSNSAIIYESSIDGRDLHFAATGKFRHGNFLLYDKETYSWWQQFTGEAIIGHLLSKKLKQVTARQESFASFKQRWPNSKVFIGEREADYSSNPYVHYDSVRRPFAYNLPFISEVDSMTYVVMVGNNAWTIDMLKKKKVIEYDGIRILWSRGQASLFDKVDLSESKDVGNVVVQSQNEKGRYYDVPYLVTFAFAFKTFVPDGKIHH